MVRFLSALIVAVLIATVFSPRTVAEDNISYLGFRLPVPVTTPEYKHPSRLNMPSTLHFVRLILSIDKKGRVTAISPECEDDSAYVDYLRDYLESWMWRPARMNGKKVASKIIAEGTFYAGYLTGEIVYAGSSLLSDATSWLRMESLRLNGIDPPSLKMLPSLSLVLDKNDTSSYCAFAVLHLELDSTGRVLSVSPVRNNAPQYLSKLNSAMLWSEFEPARVKGQALPSEIMIALTFNRNLNYPTVKWRSCCLNDLNLLQRESVRLLIDSSRYLIPPIPQLPPGDSLNLGRGHNVSADWILCHVRIDEFGKPKWMIRGKLQQSDSKVVKAIRKSVKFFPTIGSDGNPAPFEGEALIKRIDSRTVRIEYSWLGERSLSVGSGKAMDNNSIR